MLDVAAHLPALLHLKRGRGQLVGADHLGGIERNAGGRFDQYQRHRCGNDVRRGDISGFDATHRERPAFGLVLNNRSVRKGNVKGIRGGRRRGMVIRENTGQHKGGIELATNGKNKHLLANRGSPPDTRATGAAGQPV